jgi:hypothetical protein
MSKQTSTEWLFKKLLDEPKDKLTWYAILEQAKEMEKQQIIDARQDGFNRCFRKGDRKEVTNEQYYNETFNK